MDGWNPQYPHLLGHGTSKLYLLHIKTDTISWRGQGRWIHDASSAGAHILKKCCMDPWTDEFWCVDGPCLFVTFGHLASSYILYVLFVVYICLYWTLDESSWGIKSQVLEFANHIFICSSSHDVHAAHVTDSGFLWIPVGTVLMPSLYYQSSFCQCLYSPPVSPSILRASDFALMNRSSFHASMQPVLVTVVAS